MNTPPEEFSGLYQEADVDIESGAIKVIDADT